MLTFLIASTTNMQTVGSASDSASFSPKLWCAIKIYLLTYLLTNLVWHTAIISKFGYDSRPIE